MPETGVDAWADMSCRADAPCRADTSSQDAGRPRWGVMGGRAEWICRFCSSLDASGVSSGVRSPCEKRSGGEYLHRATRVRNRPTVLGRPRPLSRANAAFTHLAPSS